MSVLRIPKTVRIADSLALGSYQAARRFSNTWTRVRVSPMSTGRNADTYRRILFANVASKVMWQALRGTTVLDVGSGQTPFLTDSFFQKASAHDVCVYAVDPKFDATFSPTIIDRVMARGSGGRGAFHLPKDAAKRVIRSGAEAVPLESSSVDTILSLHALFVWIQDDSLLARLFDEFLRLLVHGGQIRIYPTPSLATLREDYPSLPWSRFEARQYFVAQFRAACPPGYTTVLEKIS